VPSGFQAFGYLSAHIPTYTAIAALGVGIELAFHDVEGGALASHGRWILCGAGALYLLGVGCIRATADRRLHLLAVHPLSPVVLMAVALVGTTLTAPAVLYVVAAVLGAELLFKGTALGSDETAHDHEEQTGSPPG
jgi:hypothetical protein